MESFPAFIPLARRRVVVVGEGGQAEAKARLFADSPAVVVQLSAAEAEAPAAFAGASLAFIAVPDAERATRAAAAAHAAGALVNVVDRPQLCDFTTPAIVDRGLVVGAIGTGGASPVLAAQLRSALEGQWPAGLGRLAAMLRKLRPELRAAFPDLAARRALVARLLAGPVAEAALGDHPDTALALARKALQEADVDAAPVGRIAWLAAPAEADRLSLRAVRALAAADRIVIDPDAPRGLLRFARRDAAVLSGGEVEASEMLEWTHQGLLAVRIAVELGVPADVAEVQRLGAEVEALPVA